MPLGIPFFLGGGVEKVVKGKIFYYRRGGMLRFVNDRNSLNHIDLRFFYQTDQYKFRKYPGLQHYCLANFLASAEIRGIVDLPELNCPFVDSRCSRAGTTGFTQGRY